MSAEEETEMSAEERIAVLEQRLAAATEETRKTTLPEYLNLCHDYLSESITIQTNKSLSTTGDPSNAKGKIRPDRLQPWKDFIETQKRTLETLYSIYPSDNMPQQFRSHHFIKAQGEEVARRPLASEQDLVILHRTIVETPVTQIVAHLKTLNDVSNAFGLAGGIEFYNHLNPLSDDADEVAQQLEAQQLQPSTPPHPAPSIS